MKTGCYFVFLLIIINVAGSGCNLKNAPGNQQESIDSMMKRETSPKEKREWVYSKDRYFAVETAFPEELKIEAHDSYYYMLIPFGSTLPIECLIYKNRLDSATTLLNLVNEVMNKAGSLEHEFTSFRADEYSGTPYLAAEVSFLNKEEEVGVFKVIVGQKATNGVACFHNEIGYRATFIQIVTSLLDSIKFLEAGHLSRFHQKEISLIYLNKRNIGFVETYHIGAKNGGEVVESFSSLILSRSREQQIAADSVSVELSGASGALKKGYYSSSQNGDAAMVLHLSPDAEFGKKYLVSGMFGGKKIKKSFEHNGPLMTKATVEKMLIDHFINKGNKEDIRISSYQPDLNPVQPILWRYQLIHSSGKEVKLRASSSSIQTDLMLDLKGTHMLEFRVGRIRLQQKRIFFHAP